MMRFLTSLLVLLLVTVVSSSVATLSFARIDLQSQHHRVFSARSIADQVNGKANVAWQAADVSERFDGRSLAEISALMGAKVNPKVRAQLPLRQASPHDVSALPASFDARDKWPMCPTVKEIRDQSSCGSCWAMAASEAASDRVCIGTSGATQLHLSSRDLLSCCTACGDGCNGGDPYSAWQWMASTGIVTGGNYDDFSWCLSYPFAPCSHHVNGTYPKCPSPEYSTPQCVSSCDTNSTYKFPYAQDKHIFATAYAVAADANSIALDLVSNGPVEAAFTVYEDFLTYRSGVYHHVTGAALGGHAVKIIGYGVENGTDYWLVANSWNTQWGDNGFFKIRRGNDECGFEDDVVAGLFH